MSAHTYSRIKHGNRARDLGSGLGSPLSLSVLLPSFSVGPGHQASQKVRPGRRERPRKTRVLLNFMSLPVREKIITDKCIRARKIA